MRTEGSGELEGQPKVCKVLHKVQQRQKAGRHRKAGGSAQAEGWGGQQQQAERKERHGGRQAVSGRCASAAVSSPALRSILLLPLSLPHAVAMNVQQIQVAHCFVHAVLPIIYDARPPVFAAPQVRLSPVVIST